MQTNLEKIYTWVGFEKPNRLKTQTQCGLEPKYVMFRGLCPAVYTPGKKTYRVATCQALSSLETSNATEAFTRPSKPGDEKKLASSDRTFFGHRVPPKRPRGRKRSIAALGRRKNAVCRLRMYPGHGDIYVNGKPVQLYFQRQTYLLHVVLKPILVLAQPRAYTSDISVYGGGLVSQAKAIQLALARAYMQIKPTYGLLLKQAGLLTRDPREKERKKYGLKKARKAPQFSKR